MPPTTTSIPPAVVDEGVDEEFVVLGPGSRSSINKECRAMGGTLPIIRDQATNDEIRAVAERKGLSETWIGLRRRLGYYDWNWVDNKVHDWAGYSGGITSVKRSHMCFTMKVSDGSWRPRKCKRKIEGLCKTEKVE